MTEETARYVCNLPEEEKKFAAAVLNEDEESRAEKIEEIRQWILQNEDLCARTDDYFILCFLRGCKFNLQKTKCKFRNYHELRSAAPEWFSNRDPFLPELQELFDLGVFLPLKTLDDEGRLVILIRATVHDPSKHKQSDVFKAGKMILEIASKINELVSLHGIVAVFDLHGVTIGHALQLPPNVIKRAVHSWQGCYPMRTQAMIFVNAPIYVNVVLNIFKSFMNSKLKSRVHVHTQGLKGLHKKISPHILPKEYGGTNGTIAELKEHWKKVVGENRQWFIDDERYKVIQ